MCEVPHVENQHQRRGTARVVKRGTDIRPSTLDGTHKARSVRYPTSPGLGPIICWHTCALEVGKSVDHKNVVHMSVARLTNTKKKGGAGPLLPSKIVVSFHKIQAHLPVLFGKHRRVALSHLVHFQRSREEVFCFVVAPSSLRAMCRSGTVTVVERE